MELRPQTIMQIRQYIGDVSPMNHEYINSGSNKDICEAFGCESKATTTIEVPVGVLGIISLFLCEGCVSKFKQEDA
jgi:hypothetical protein